MIMDMLQFYNMMKGSNINVIYNGPIWSDGVEGIGSTLRKNLEAQELPLSASQAVFSVFVEQMNNMLHYSSEKESYCNKETGQDSSVGSGIFLVGSEGKQYFMQTGNMIQPRQCELIKDRIDYLNTLDKSEMRKFYKEKIKSENNNPDSKGAGIGLIEIARRANSPVQYTFTEIDADNTFFSMYVTIG